MAIQTGQQAPEFTLRDSDKQEVKLGDYKDLQAYVPPNCAPCATI